MKKRKNPVNMEEVNMTTQLDPINSLYTIEGKCIRGIIKKKKKK